MNNRLRFALVLAGISGVLLASAGSFVYAQSTAQQSRQQTCGSTMSGFAGTGMVNGAGEYGSMGQGQCMSMMNNHNWTMSEHHATTEFGYALPLVLRGILGASRIQPPLYSLG